MARILVVDDDLSFRRLLEVILAKDGHEVLLAKDGPEGLDLHERTPADLIVLDLIMPEVHGFEVLRTLRAAGDKVPVLVYSSQEGDLDRLQGFLLGADDYAVKPFSPQELRLRIRALLRRSQADGPPVFRSGPFQLDASHHSVTRDGALLDLRTTDFRLLETLVSARGDLCSSTRLGEAVGIPADLAPTMLQGRIRRLRTTLGTVDGSSPILTVTGKGYRWGLPVVTA